MRTPVTGGSTRSPILDRQGVPLHVGDTLRAQCCVGRYGEVRTVEHSLTPADAHWPLCFLDTRQLTRNAEGRQVSCLITTRWDAAAGVLRCQDTHHDVEHGHQTWAEILPKGGNDGDVVE